MGIVCLPTRARCPVAVLPAEGQLLLLRVLCLGAILMPAKNDRLLMPGSRHSENSRGRLWHMMAEDTLGGKEFPLQGHQYPNTVLAQTLARTQLLCLYGSLARITSEY